MGTEAPHPLLLTLLSDIRSEVRAIRRDVAELRAPAAAAPEGDPVDRLRVACERAGIEVSIDDHVDEAGAARLFGISRGGLKRRRQECRLPVQHRLNLGRVEYPLAGIAAALAEREENDE